MPESELTLADGRYTLHESIGTGGMATVYRATDDRLQVTRAVKVLNQAFASKRKIRARFEAEARTMAVLDHPNIVRVYDVGSEGDTVYIVMELVKGETLLQRIERTGPMTAGPALQIIRDLLCGLQAAHAQTIIHRDIKPHNVLLSEDGRVRITDFGIARSMHLTEESFTKTGAVMGTWAFMAPEQRVNSKGVDLRADIYGTGATLFAMVTQRTPMDLFASDLDPVMLRGVPDSVLPIIRKATRYQPDERYGDVGEFIAAIDQVLSTVQTSPQPVPQAATSSEPTPLDDAVQAAQESPVSATFLPEDVSGLLAQGSTAPPATRPPPPAPPQQDHIDAPLSSSPHSGTLLPEDEMQTEATSPPRSHNSWMVIALIAILVLVVIGTVGRYVMHTQEAPAPPSPPTVSPAPTPDAPPGKAERQRTVPQPERPAEQTTREDKPDRKEAEPAPSPERVLKDNEPEEPPTPTEPATQAQDTTTPGEGLRLLASVPSSAKIGQRLAISARIPSATIKEHLGYSVRLSYRPAGGHYRRVEMRREGKVWRAAIQINEDMTNGLEWCMFAKPDPAKLPDHPKLTSVACSAPRRVRVGRP